MKNKKGLIILIIILVLALAAGIFGNISKNEVEEDEEEPATFNTNIVNFDKNFNFGTSKTPKKIKHDYIAVLHINGVISEANRTYNQKWLMKTIEKLTADKRNYGILLYIDSPGGTVYQSDETYLALLDYKKNTERPIYAYFASIAASGGYYIGCAADKIYANRNCLTGSIGVIAGSSLDATGMLDKIGVKSTTFTAGRNKNMLNYNNPLTEEQREIMQSVADDAYEQFTGIVSESRKMDINTVKQIADGRIYTARQAKENGLIDGIMSLEEAKSTIKEEMDLNASFEDFKYEYDESFFKSLMSSMSFFSNPKASLEGVLGESKTMKLNYMAY